MHQAKFSLTESQLEFLNEYLAWGFSDKSSVVRAAIENLRRELAQQRLEQSADLYADVYADDGELQALTEQAMEDWPE